MLVRIREYRECGVNALRVNRTGETFDEQVRNPGRLMELV